MQDEGENLVTQVAVGELTRDQIQITVEGRLLSITGSGRAAPAKPAGDAPTPADATAESAESTKAPRMNPPAVWASFTRRATLPSEVDAERGSAALDGGMLRVTLPKRASPRGPIRIPIA